MVCLWLWLCFLWQVCAPVPHSRTLRQRLRRRRLWSALMCLTLTAIWTGTGRFAGIDVELATEAFSRLGYTPEFRTISWPDKNNLLSDGTIDCIWSCFSMNGRETNYQWAGPYMYSRQVVAVRADSDIQSLSDLAGKRIGVQATTKAESLFLGEISSLLPEVKQVNSFETTEDMFAALSQRLCRCRRGP